jgi:hypothetical protein
VVDEDADGALRRQQMGDPVYDLAELSIVVIFDRRRLRITSPLTHCLPLDYSMNVC